MAQQISLLNLPQWLIDSIDPVTTACSICGTAVFSNYLSITTGRPPQYLFAPNVAYTFDACSAECLEDLMSLHHVAL
jgi:hypothetical protein